MSEWQPGLMDSSADGGNISRRVTVATSGWMLSFGMFEPSGSLVVLKVMRLLGSGDCSVWLVTSNFSYRSPLPA